MVERVLSVGVPASLLRGTSAVLEKDGTVAGRSWVAEFGHDARALVGTGGGGGGDGQGSLHGSAGRRVCLCVWADEPVEGVEAT